MPQRPVPRIYGVYTITCTANGRQYVGSSSNVHDRWSRHKYRLRHDQHHLTDLQADWDEHGEAAFQFRIVEKVRDPAARLAVEQVYLDTALAVGLAYNRNPRAATAAGFRWTAEQRQALSDALRGRTVSEETRRKIGEANRELWASREITPEFRERMADIGRKGRGRPKSAETRAKMSASQKGRVKSPEERAAISAAMTGKPKSAKQRRAIGEAMLGQRRAAKITEDQVREIKRRLAAGETGTVLAAEFGISQGTISNIKSGHTWQGIE